MSWRYWRMVLTVITVTLLSVCSRRCSIWSVGGRICSVEDGHYENLHCNLYYFINNLTWSVYLCTFTGMGLVKMKHYHINPRFHIRVCDLMKEILSRPKHKSRFLVGDGEILPIITVECEV